MRKIKYDPRKIREQWDLLAQHRLEQFEEKKDNSFEYFLKPMVLKYLENINFKNAVDLGCGVGNLTYEISQYKQGKLHGIDFSSKNIEIAKSKYDRHNLSFDCIDVDSYLSQSKDNLRLDCVIANMFFQDFYPIEGLLKKIAFHLIENGHLIFTITHPCFWPKYWKYEYKEWFSYKKEIAIEAPFLISSDGGYNYKDVFYTTHFHRPLEFYINNLLANHFKIVEFNEIKPDYPEVNYPRFLSMKCIKT